MPEHKKPLIRYHVIDRCIRNTARRYAFEDLLSEINQELVYRNLEPIGKTTFYQDIKDMQLEFNAPIETYWHNRKKYYRYTDDDYAFGNQPLNQGEVEHLRDSVMILNRFSGLPGFEWIDDLISKLELGTYDEVNDPTVISFESDEFLKGKEFIGPLFKAILDKKVLDIGYRTFSSDSDRVHRIHPYHLKEYDSRWYLFGLYKRKDSLIPLSVDRIVGISEAKQEEYIPNSNYNFSEYFEDIIGIRRDPGDVKKIYLRFNSIMAPYVLTKPLHGSQKIVRKHDDGVLEISIEVIPNFELDRLIFSFRNGVEVTGPEDYRSHIKVLLEESAVNYQ